MASFFSGRAGSPWLTVVLAPGFAALGAEIRHAYRPLHITHANTPTVNLSLVRLNGLCFLTHVWIFFTKRWLQNITRVRHEVLNSQ